MSKIIKITPEVRDELVKSVVESLDKAISGSKLSDGVFTYTKRFNDIGRKAELLISPVAFFKMQALVNGYSSEVAWHGTAFRDDDEGKDRYYIKDVMVYPQTVTGVTVTTDQEKYQAWLMNHEDEVFNNIRFQGHSHVNMGVTPSQTDLTHQKKILEQLEDDMFYIFMICNKSGSIYSVIYDMKKNVLFESADISVRIDLDGLDVNGFVNDSKKLVVQSYQSGGYYGSGWQYGGGNKDAGSTSGIQNINYNGGAAAQNAVASDTSKNKTSSSEKTQKKKDKKKKNKTTIASGNFTLPANCLSSYCYDDDDDLYDGGWYER